MKRKVLGRILFALAVIIILLSGVLLFSCRQAIATSLTLRAVGKDSNLLVMENKVDYDLDDLVNSNVVTVSELVDYVTNLLTGGLIGQDFEISNSAGFGCTSIFCITQDNDCVLARNFDYGTDGGVLVYSEPEDGYKSYSMCSPENLDIEIEELKSNPFKRLLASAFVFIPVDGFNEKGLSISVNEVGNNSTDQNTGKPGVFITTVVRYVLDRCETVEEALDFINSVDVHDVSGDFFDGESYHYLIADSYGTSAIVEFDYKNGFETKVFKREYGADYQVLTNHYIIPEYEQECSDDLRSGERFETATVLLSKGLERSEDCFTVLDACKIDPPVKYEKYDDYYCGTKWSVVYNLTSKELEINMNGEDEIYSFSFENR